MACGFSSTIITTGAGGMFNNGHVAISKDLIFGLCTWDGNTWVPLTQLYTEDLEMVKGLVVKGNHPFQWWDALNAAQPRE